MTRPILLPLLVVSALASSGCEKTASPIGPGPPPSSQLGSGALSLEGPSSVAPGRTAAFRLLLSSLGTSQDVSSRALWSTSEPSILDVTTPGTVVGRTRGEAIIQTRYQGVTTSASVYVLEDGTFKLAGRVLDGTVGLPGARLQITTGMGAGLEATSDGLGRYAIYGVAGGITIETMLTEYATVTRAVMVANHAALDVPLEPSGGRRQLAGRWTLSISASPACTDVPPDARLRTYEVDAVQQASEVQLALRSETMVWGAGVSVRIEGRLLGRTLTLTFPDEPINGPSLQEYLSPLRVFSLAGLATGSVDDAGVTGTLSGFVGLEDLSTRTFQACERADHSFRLARR